MNSTVDSVGHDSHYFRALEALSALKLVLRHQTLGATAAAKGTSQWPAFHPEELAHLGSAERPAPQMEDSVGIASAAAATPVHAGHKLYCMDALKQNKLYSSLSM